MHDVLNMLRVADSFRLTEVHFKVWYLCTGMFFSCYRPMYYAPVSVNPQGPLQATQGILTSHPRGYDNGVQTRSVLTFKIMRFPPPGIGNRGFWHKMYKWWWRLLQKKFSNIRILWVCLGEGADYSHWLVH